MELKHYTLSQLLTAYSRDHVISISVEHAGAPGPYILELDHEKSVQVREIGWRVGSLMLPSEEEVVAKRLYKMRFVEGPVCKGQHLTFEASVRNTKVVVIVADPKITAAAESSASPCVSLDLSKKAEAPVVAINVGEPRPAANEGDANDEVRSYTLNHIILPYEAMYLQTTFSLKFDFSRVKAHAGVEECGFICTPNMDRIISDLSYLKTSASPELCQVFDNIKNLKFIQGVAYDDDIAVYLATKGDTTIRVTVIKGAELDEAHAQIPEPVKAVKDEPKTMKEVAISWLRKIFS